MNESILTKDGKIAIMHRLDIVLRYYMQGYADGSEALSIIALLKDAMRCVDEPFMQILNAAEMFIMSMETDYYKPKYAASIILYVIKFNNNTVKIGVTKNFEKRKKQIEHQSGLTAEKWELFTNVDNARNKESAAHKYFAAQRLNGEYFGICFDEAVDYVKLSL